MRGLRALVQLELLALLRTREIYTFGIVPVVGFVPVLLICLTLYGSLQVEMFVPTQDPDGLTFDVRDRLRTDSPDPEAYAIRSWSRAEDGRVEAVVHVADQVQLAEAGTRLRRWVEEALREQLEAAGGDPEVDRLRVHWRSGSLNTLSMSALLGLLVLIVSAQVSTYLVPSRTAADRLGGRYEAYLVTRTPLWQVLAARAFAVALVLMSLACLAFALPPALLPDASFPFALCVELTGAVLLVTSVQTLVGAVAGSARTALNAGAYVSIVVALVPLLGFFGATWLPVAGLGQEVGWLAWGARTSGSWALAGGVLAFGGWWLRGERALPPGHADE